MDVSKLGQTSVSTVRAWIRDNLHVRLRDRLWLAAQRAVGYSNLDVAVRFNEHIADYLGI
jgi:hypothetical protein